MNELPRSLRWLALASAAIVLAGCSSMRIVDSDVTAFSVAGAPALGPSVRYRFERLPSQRAAPTAQQSLEELASRALAKAGLVHDDAAAQFSVQLGYRVFRDPQAPWDDPLYIRGIVRPYPIVGRFGVVMRNPALDFRFDFPYYRRDLSLIVRRVGDGQVVYETRAQHDGRWPDDEAVVPAMLQAALQGFPTPPSGPRRIAVEIPR